MFEIIFLIAAGIYFLVLIWLSAGLMKKLPFRENKPPVSVIIAARNEEDNITGCLTSLSAQDYPDYEVIIADDLSTDRTCERIDSFIQNRNNFKKVIPPKESSLTGKANALNAAIENASGEILLFTDADCFVPPEWIKTMAGYYEDKTGMVNSFSVTDAENILSGVEGIDLVFLVSVAAGMANNRLPVSCIGNNMSVRRDIYNKTGGYNHIPASVTEDYALLNKVHDSASVVFPLDPGAVVKTKALNNIRDIIRQKKRWAVGGLSKLNKSIILMLVSYLVNLLIIMSLFFYSQQILLIILFKVFSDFFFLYQVHSILNLKNNMKYFIFFEIYYILYTALLPLILLFSRKIVWKERIYYASSL